MYFGVFASSAFWAPALLVEQVSGASPQAMGATAEEWTSNELHKARLTPAEVFDHISFRTHDIDHAVVTPDAALVVETKWRSGTWIAHPPDQRLGAAAAQAQAQARKFRIMLHSVAFDHIVPVSPIVVVWGERDWGRGEVVVVDGCTVVAGSDLRSWIQTWAGLQAETETASFKRATAELRNYQRARDRYDESIEDVPLIVRSGVGRLGEAMTEITLAFSLSLLATSSAVAASIDSLGLFALFFLLAPAVLGISLRRRRPFVGWGFLASTLVLVIAGAASLAAHLL